MNTKPRPTAAAPDAEQRDKERQNLNIHEVFSAGISWTLKPSMLKLHVPPEMFVPIAPYVQAIEATEVQRLVFISATIGLEPGRVIFR